MAATIGIGGRGDMIGSGDLDDVTDGARLDPTNTRNHKRVTSLTPELRNGAENTRSDQLRAKGAPTQSVTWPKSKGGTR